MFILLMTARKAWLKKGYFLRNLYLKNLASGGSLE
jgi:hypothetical protein